MHTRLNVCKVLCNNSKKYSNLKVSVCGTVRRLAHKLFCFLVELIELERSNDRDSNAEMAVGATAMNAEKNAEVDGTPIGKWLATTFFLKK